MVSFFAQNLKYLRKLKGYTQGDFAQKIGINRPKIGSYEEGRAEPKLETLQNISHFFKVKIDDLLEKDLSKSKRISTKDIEGNNLRILPIIVDDNQNEKISLVPIKAAAGYLNGYSDPEYVEDLPTFNLPFSQLGQGTHRAFQIKGDSMLPIESESYILGQYLENWNWIKDGECYIIVSKEEGVVYKRVVNALNQEEKRFLELHSDNKNYEPYTVAVEEILEVWRALGFISFNLPEKNASQLSVEQLSSVVLQLKNEVDQLKNQK